MPDMVIHYAMGQDVRRGLKEDIRQKLVDAPFTMALYGPDPWFMHKPWIHGSGRGRTMHTRKTGLFLLSLAERARTERNSPAGNQIFSYMAGFTCHYAMDSTAHPYIIWKTTEEFRQVQSHRAFEHCLDVEEMRRAGKLEGEHPVTENYLPALRLPREMKEGLDQVYLRVYGWEEAWRGANRCYGQIRALYRVIENPRGLISALARRTGRELLQGFCYSENYLKNVDAENNARKEWRSAFHPEEVHTTSFGDMRREATERAVRIITAARDYMDAKDGDPEALREIIGNDSYLSGLDADDPRNWSIPSMSPARLQDEKE